MHNKSIGFYPRISIITVCYNAERQLKETIKSVVNQTYKNIEYIVIDGASLDGTTELLKKYGSSINYWVSEPDNGIYDAMNKGLSVSTGDYVQFLNAGDLFYKKNSLEVFICAANTHHDLIYGDIMLVGVNGTFQRHHVAKDFTLEKLKMFGTGVLCHQAMLVHRTIAPMFNTKYKYKGELNWYFDILSRKSDLSYFHYDQPLVFYFLGGIGYKNFFYNRLEWYILLCSRFGIRSVINRQFIYFIYNDFKNRYIKLKK